MQSNSPWVSLTSRTFIWQLVNSWHHSAHALALKDLVKVVTYLTTMFSFWRFLKLFSGQCKHHMFMQEVVSHMCCCRFCCSRLIGPFFDLLWLVYIFFSSALFLVVLFLVWCMMSWWMDILAALYWKAWLYPHPQTNCRCTCKVRMGLWSSLLDRCKKTMDRSMRWFVHL